MKNTIKRLSLLFLAIASIMFFMSCGEPGDGGTTAVAVTFVSAEQTGGTSDTVDSTGLTLTFSDDPTTLTADDITLTGATKGTLSGSGTTRTLGISDITVENGGNVNITINNPSGYTISGSPKTAIVYNVYNLRDTGPAGGLIFYINPNAATDGWKYLEAAPKTTEWKDKQWGKKGTSVNGTDTAIGTGKANTNLILDVLDDDPPETGRAAQVADELESGGYTDWFLPSKDELYKMYEELYKNDVGDFVSGHSYWSSSEYNADEANYKIFDETTSTKVGKDSTMYVRAARSF